MYYAFDQYGWFAGGVANGSPRSVPDVPPDVSVNSQPGAPRAFWNGFAWEMRAYVLPSSVPPQEDSDPPDVLLYRFIWALDKLHNITENDCDTAIAAVANNQAKRRLKAWFGRGPNISARSWEFKNLRDALGINNKKMNAAMWWAADKSSD